MPRYFFAPLAALFILASLCAGLPAPQVQAQENVQIKLCNETSYVIQAATAFQIGAASQSKGWRQILPGACATAPMKAGANGRYYVYAQSIGVHAGAVQRFKGNEQFCIGAPSGFEIDGRRECRERGHAMADFAPTDIDAQKSLVTFTDPLDFGTKRARIAGAQRLLSDIGYDVGKVDGFMGRRTRTALEDFRKKHELPPKLQITSAFLAKLLEVAAIHSDKRGLILCNKTSDLIWAALGEISRDSFKTQGWLKVQPKQCTKGINAILTNRYYFVYAEAVDDNGNPVMRAGRRQVWAGDFSLCTKPTRFTIEGRNDCASQGFDKTGFMKIDTGSKPSWVVSFE